MKSWGSGCPQNWQLCFPSWSCRPSLTQLSITGFSLSLGIGTLAVTTLDRSAVVCCFALATEDSDATLAERAGFFSVDRKTERHCPKCSSSSRWLSGLVLHSMTLGSKLVLS